MENEDLPTMIAAEFKLLGFRAHTRDVQRLADALAALEVEFGELGVTAACIGYITAWRIAAS